MAKSSVTDYLKARLTADWLAANKRRAPISQHRIEAKVVQMAELLQQFNFEQRASVLQLLGAIQSASEGQNE
jgi:hypothetical protein